VLATEIELAALRSQFVATSEEIAKDLALLAGRIDEEPTEVRAPQLAAAKEITAAQERLRLEADRLEGPPEQCVALMRAVLEAQQAAQLQLAVILKRHRPSSLLRTNLHEWLANIARQLEASAAAPRLADESRVQLPTNISGSEGQASHARSIADEPRSGNDNGDLRSDHSNDDTAEEMQSPSMPLTAIIKAGTSLALLLAVASAGLALFFLYTSLPGARPHREVAAVQPSRERRGRANTPMPRPEGEGVGTSAQLAAVGSTEGPPKMSSAASSAPTGAATPKPTAPPSAMSNAAGITPKVAVPPAGLRRSDPSAVAGILPDGRQPGISTTAAQPPLTPVLAPPSPTSSNDAEKFVPVVFTHKDKGTALRTFAELQRRYPKLMAHRQSELQTVDTGNNGIWYRLVVLPAGSHQEASETCGRLQAAGYDRCWVKAY
jgi:hypothetical protein